MNSATTYENHCTGRGLIAPAGLTKLLTTDIAARLDGLLYRPDSPKESVANLNWALGLLSDSADAPPPNLLPLVPVDDSSIACAVCGVKGEESHDAKVIRWHLNKVPARFQGACLDSSAESYVRSVADELDARKRGLAEIRGIATRYKRRYSSAERRPPGWETRPVQIACQNVIVGLGAIAHDSTFDGLRTHVYLTCEVPHLATHEANRAMAALMLCDAFQNGGTMEIRFGSDDRAREVPPALKRFGRSLGIKLGAEDSRAITPAEARDLFLAVTPMPSDLWARVVDFMDRGLTSPERLCYTLLAPVWPAIELDYLLATSARAISILHGGASFELRRARLAESEVARAAHMVGMLFRRLDCHDGAMHSGAGVRVFEDMRAGVEWAIDDVEGIVTYLTAPGVAPWSNPRRIPVCVGQNGLLRVIPRGLATPDDWQLVLRSMEESPETSVALLIPADMADAVPAEVPILLCPERLAEIDGAVERKLQSGRVGRS